MRGSDIDTQPGSTRNPVVTLSPGTGHGKRAVYALQGNVGSLDLDSVGHTHRRQKNQSGQEDSVDGRP
jgi:NAD(P)H-dependent FMN reductase